MKILLTISMFLFSYLTFSQSIAYKQINIIEVDEKTDEVIKEYNTGYYMEFIVGDTLVKYQLQDHTGGIIEKIDYKITQKETIDETYVISMKFEDEIYELLIPFDKKEKISLNSNGVTKIIYGKSQKIKD
ncbi:hypothetical protein ERX46_00375 [Brumimicrobium glaciale]|uniref:Uncharacterized protein n=1 Tax=Brumimicrobium glaciale TaxID=200475 RepID=A0A4Q4KPQ9_9FLAO|nr:hypothetical protein [Brumimicrobium glaciale]RYM35480.1 hypothetical protein ERX46_00375 [Brumimicrobium glaciale]